MPVTQTGPGARRELDAAALQAAQRRLAQAPQPPWLHAEVARRMAERLAVVKLQPAVIVDWWGFGGASAAVLGAAYPRARRIVVEPSAALVARSRAAAASGWWRRLRQGGRSAEVHLEDVDSAPGSAQLLWSNMALHAAVDPPAVLARWQRLLAADGFAMFSCLGPGSLRGLHALYRESGWGTPGAAFVDMHDLGDMLIETGFADPVMDQELLTLTWESPQALLCELRGLGGNWAPSRSGGLRTPRWHARLVQALGALAGSDGRLRLDFEIVYGHAFKAAPRPERSAETTLSVEEMRARLRAAGRKRT